MAPVTHTVTRTVTIAGTLEYPTSIEPLFDADGALLLAEDGTPTAVWLGSKRAWKLVWDSPRPEVVERLRTRYAARASFTFVDPYAASYSALIPPNGLGHGVSYEPASKSAAGTTYQLTVEVREA